MSNTDSVQNQHSVNYQFKLLYALGILFIVVGHSSYAYLPFFEKWFIFSSFHLGLFVFCSGYFYKEKSESNILKYVFKKIKTLILPLFLWNLFYALVTKVFSSFGMTIGGDVTLEKIFITPLTHGHQFVYNLGGWFVVPLFLIEIFNILFCKVLPLKDAKKFILLFVIYLIIGIFGNKLAINGYNTDWWLTLTRMTFLLPFFGFGMLYKNLLEEKDVLSSTSYFAIVFALQLVLFIYLKEVPSIIVMPAWSAFAYGPIVPYFAGLIGIAFWLRVARDLTPVCGQNKCMLAVANNTYSIMINQFLGFILVKSFFALMKMSFGFFRDFDIVKYKTDLWYYYCPNNIEHFGIIYIIAGLFVPVYMQKGLNWTKDKIISIWKQKKKSVD